MLRSIITKESQFKRFKDRWNEVKDDLDALDTEIYDILVGINEIPGVVTVFSCAGHHEDPEDSEQFYIACAVDKEGITNLQKFFGDLREELLKRDLLAAFHVSLSSNVLLYTEPCEPGVWNCWTLEGFLTENEKKLVIECFEKALNVPKPKPLPPVVVHF